MPIFLMLSQNIFTPYKNIEEACQQFNVDLNTLLALHTTCYLNGQDHRVPKSGQMHLAWEYASNPADHGHFSHMFCVSPHVFQTILSLIQHHPVFTSHSNVPQAPVEVQLAVTPHHMGWYGNSTYIQDIAWTAGCSEGSVENYTDCCFDAIESLQEIFICRLTPEEKEQEKQWIDQKLRFEGAWRDGWLMYDGTIVVLY